MELAILLAKLFEAENERLSSDELAALESKLEGALVGVSTHPSKQKILQRIRSHDWNFLEGYIRNILDENKIRAAGGVSVNASASATATSTVTLAMTIDAIEHGKLSDEQKKDLKHELVDAEDSAKKGNLAKFVPSVVSACEKAGKCANSLTAVLTFFAELAKQIPTDGTNSERPI